MFSRFEKLDVMFLIFLHFALIVKALPKRYTVRYLKTDRSLNGIMASAVFCNVTSRWPRKFRKAPRSSHKTAVYPMQNVSARRKLTS